MQGEVFGKQLMVVVEECGIVFIVVVVDEDVVLEEVVEDSPGRSVVVVEEDVVFEDKFMDERIMDVVSPFIMVVVPVKIVDSVDVDV